MSMNIEVWTTLAIGAFSWLIKEVLFKGLESSRVSARAEWERQLREVWSPLYANLILLFESDADRQGSAPYIKKIESIVELSVHLLPRENLARIGRILSYFKGHGGASFTKGDVVELTEFVYRKVEEINFVLYQDEPAYRIDGRMHPLVWYLIIFRYLVRLLWHIGVWALIAMCVLYVVDAPVEVPSRILKVAWSALAIALVLDAPRLKSALRESFLKLKRRYF